MELDSLSLIDLRNLAKDKGISNISKLKKSELIEKILENYNNQKNENSNENNVVSEKVISENAELSKDEKNSEIEYKLTSEDDEYVEGILELLPDGYGFLRGDNYLSTNKDVYVSPVQIRRFKLDTGDMIKGIKRTPKEGEKFPALIYVGEVNGEHPENAMKRKNFDDLIPIYPLERLKLETSSSEYTMRLMDLMSPIGK